jgi:hypothetical protein
MAGGTIGDVETETSIPMLSTHHRASWRLLWLSTPMLLGTVQEL